MEVFGGYFEFDYFKWLLWDATWSRLPFRRCRVRLYSFEGQYFSKNFHQRARLSE